MRFRHSSGCMQLAMKCLPSTSSVPVCCCSYCYGTQASIRLAPYQRRLSLTCSRPQVCKHQAQRLCGCRCACQRPGNVQPAHGGIVRGACHSLDIVDAAPEQGQCIEKLHQASSHELLGIWYTEADGWFTGSLGATVYRWHAALRVPASLARYTAPQGCLGQPVNLCWLLAPLDSCR